MYKRLLSTTVIAFSLLLSSQAVFADTSLGATEPNNTFSEATLIQRNNADHPDKAYTVYYGSMDTTDDVDIFQVYLPAGANTLIVQAYYADLHVSLFNQNQDRIHEEIFGNNNKQYDFHLDTNQGGLYYVQIETEAGTRTDLIKTPSYRLVVGNPYYSWGSFTQKDLGTLSITPRSSTSRTAFFDLTSNNDIPNGSIVDSIRFGGQEDGSVSGRVRSVRPSGSSRWLDGREFWFEAANVSTSSSPVYLKQFWTYRHSASSFGYTKTYSLTPEVYFRYYYPQDLDNYMIKF